MDFFCFIEQVSCFFEIMLYLCDNFKTNGALAHLARAFDWQSKGGRFESCMLHKKSFYDIYPYKRGDLRNIPLLDG